MTEWTASLVLFQYYSTKVGMEGTQCGIVSYMGKNDGCLSHCGVQLLHNVNTCDIVHVPHILQASDQLTH